MLRVLLLLLVVSAAVLGLRLFGRADTQTSAQPPLSTPANSDYYMTDAVVHQMNEKGQLAYRMTLGRILHFPSDSARLSDIDVHYISSTKTYWDVTARKGRVPAGKRDIYLYGGVNARQPRPGGSAVTVKTDNVWVRPDADRIDTKAHVTATQPGQRIAGDGMEVDLKTDRLRLLKNVQVNYTP